MKYLIDIELSGLIAIEAESKEDAIDIAERIGTDDLKDALLNGRARFVEVLEPGKEADFKCFSELDI